MVRAEAKVGNTLYATFAEAVAAAQGSAITLLTDGIAYEMHADEILRVNQNGHTFNVTAPEGFYLEASDPDENGVVTYTVTTAVAKIGEMLYASLKDAVAAAAEGDTIVMIADSSETERVRVDVPIIIDLNGKVVTNDSDTLMNASADLTIRDSSDEGTGALRSNASNGRAIQVLGGTTTLKSGELYGKQIGVLTSGAAFVMDGGKVSGGDGLYAMSGSLTVNAGTVSASGTAISGLNDSTVTINGGSIQSSNVGFNLYDTAKAEINGGTIHGYMYGFCAFDTAKMVINDGTITANGYPISSNFHSDAGIIVTIKGGNVIQLDEDQPAIYMPGIGTVNIEGGTITGKYAVDMRHGYLNISGGTLTGVGECAVQIYSLCWGANDLRSDADRVNYAQTPEVHVTGGYFAGADGYDAIKFRQGSKVNADTGEECIGGLVEDFITGGFFTTSPDMQYCGTDTEGNQLYPIPNDDETYKYTVGEAVATVNGNYFTTFAAAAEARTSYNDVITLLGNISEQYTMTAQETLKVEKNGKTFKTPAVEGPYIVKSSTANGVTTYSTVEADIEYTAANGTVSYKLFSTSVINGSGAYKLLKDIAATMRIVPGILASDVTLDLNGHTLTSTAGDCAILLSRNGTASAPKTFAMIDSSENGGGKLIATGLNPAESADALISVSGKYNNVTIGAGVTVEGGCVALISENQKLDVYGAINGGGDFAIATNGSLTKNVEINIHDGAAITSETVAIYLPGTGTTTIEQPCRPFRLASGK